MNVSELKKALQDVDPDLQVRVYWAGSDRNTIDGIFLQDAQPEYDIPKSLVLVGEWACYEKPKNIIWGEYEI